MAKAILVPHIAGQRIMYRCPGCGNIHSLDINMFNFNGNFLSPSITPTIQVVWGNNICHSQVHDGKITFLPDSTHDKAGQTLDLLDIGTEDVPSVQDVINNL